MKYKVGTVLVNKKDLTDVIEIEVLPKHTLNGCYRVAVWGGVDYMSEAVLDSRYRVKK